MIRQDFYLGNHDWHFSVYYGVRTEQDICEVYDKLLDSGMGMRNACRALQELSQYDSGYTHTDFNRRETLMFMSKTTSHEQMYDSIQHETRHAADHIGEYCGMEARGEDSAYLQGEIARKMFPGAAMVICPKCNNHHDNES